MQHAETQSAAAAAPDLFDELLAEALPAPSADPLEDLLAEAIADATEEKRIKAAKERLKRGGLSARERAEDAELVARHQAANDWNTVASVALFDRTVCACGKHATTFKQILAREVHRTLPNTQRWRAVDDPLPDLPREVAVQKWNVPMCPVCIGSTGFEFRNVTEWKG